jgi:hypothetical protein
MESNKGTDIDKLITFGQMALEQGWYDQARDYFEQALALDATNREAMKGLARANEILSRKAGLAARPIQVEPAKPRPKVATKRTGMHGLAAILVLVVVTLVWIAYSMFIEPRREAAVAPTAAAISIETPRPTPTLKPLPTPTPAAVTGILFGESVQRQIYSDLMAALNDVGDKAYETVAQQWGTTVDIVKAIAIEGFKKNWVTATPHPTSTAVPIPTATPGPTAMPTKAVTADEVAYWKDLESVMMGWLVGYFAINDLIVELDKNGRLLNSWDWQYRVGVLLGVMESACRRFGELRRPPALFEEPYRVFVRVCEASDRGEPLVREGIENENLEKIAEGWVQFMLGFNYIDGITRPDD